MATRRKFLKLLGVSTASAPLAAKEIADKEMAGLIMRGGEASPLAPTTQGREPWRVQEEEHRKTIPKAIKWIKDHGVPEYMERRLRENSSLVTALDPDIAAKRSWSMSVKIQEQRQRQYERSLKRHLEGGAGHTARETFEKAIGFTWPWYL